MLTFTFYLFSAVAIASAVLCITRRSPVASALWLASTLFQVAGLFVVLGAPFLGAVQVLVYVGAIMVLFLFVIMLVNLDVALRQEQFNRQWGIAGVAAFLLAGELAAVIYLGRGTAALPQAPPGALQPNTELIGTSLYQTYMLPFEIASLLLLVAMVGAVLMARRKVS